MKISVIIPCYNVEKWIDRCLESVICQTIGLDKMEILCIDDCSSDSTLLKLKAWEERYPEHFIIIESSENGRQGTARNIGLSYATGEWISFIDSDDWVEKDYLEQMLTIGQQDEY
ncbi:MAG: glycosyltransferase, partial [Lachnospiraceae bacterium]|nr:glycosyltransferase [Lachnospiraceae bacterium]